MCSRSVRAPVSTCGQEKTEGQNLLLSTCGHRETQHHKHKTPKAGEAGHHTPTRLYTLNGPPKVSHQCPLPGESVQPEKWVPSSTCVREKTEGQIFCRAPVDEGQTKLTRHPTEKMPAKPAPTQNRNRHHDPFPTTRDAVNLLLEVKGPASGIFNHCEYFKLPGAGSFPSPGQAQYPTPNPGICRRSRPSKISIDRRPGTHARTLPRRLAGAGDGTQ